MPERLPPLRALLRSVFIVIIVAGLAFYALFEARRLIAGPEIFISSPQNGSAVGGETVTIAGSARNIAFLSINGKQAFVDTAHRFSETLAPAEGYAVFEVSGTDQFGRTVSKDIEIQVLPECLEPSRGAKAGEA